VTLVCCRGIFVYTTSSPITLFLFGRRSPVFTKLVDVRNVVNWRKFDRYQTSHQPLTPLCFVFSTLHIYVTWQRVFQVVATCFFFFRTGGRFGSPKIYKHVIQLHWTPESRWWCQTFSNTPREVKQFAPERLRFLKGTFQPSFSGAMLNFGRVCLYFHPYLGKIPILTNIFQLGWNHKLEIHLQRRYVHELASLRSENIMQWQGEMGLSSQKLDMENWVIGFVWVCMQMHNCKIHPKKNKQLKVDIEWYREIIV